MADHKIKWNGLVDDSESDSLASADNNEVPESVDIVWGGYVPCWYPANHADCVIEDMYFEDFDVDTGVGDGTFKQDGLVDGHDGVRWNDFGRGDIYFEIVNMLLGNRPFPDKAPKNTYTWGDVSFVIEIADGLGTGNRRAREARLQQLDKDKKKRLIRLICRVKGEKVYDEEKEVGDIQLRLDDVDMVINKVIGTMKVSTEWEEVPWDYGYDK